MLALLLLPQHWRELGLKQRDVLLQLQLTLQCRSLFSFDCLQPFVDPAPLLHGGLKIRQLLLGVVVGCLSFLAAALRFGQH